MAVSISPTINFTALETLDVGVDAVPSPDMVVLHHKLQDANGLKLQTIMITNPSGNNPITIGEGASNGYPIWGASNDVIYPAATDQGTKFSDSLPDVSATDKTIDITGTGTETFDVGICLG